MRLLNIKTSVVFMVVMIFIIGTPLFAQGLPGSIIEETFATLAGLVAGVVLLTGIYKKYISDKNTFIVSVVISTIVCAAGWFLQLGIFAGLLWWHAILYDIGVILIIKGTVSIDLIKSMLGIFGIGPNKK